MKTSGVREVQLIDHTVSTAVRPRSRKHHAGPRQRPRPRRDLADNNPPVAKIMDYGKYRFQEQKKAAEARKKQKTVEVKEIKLRPGIDKHDYEVKMRAMQRFFGEGDKVKVTLRFRGREDGASGAWLQPPEAGQGRQPQDRQGRIRADVGRRQVVMISRAKITIFVPFGGGLPSSAPSCISAPPNRPATKGCRGGSTSSIRANSNTSGSTARALATPIHGEPNAQIEDQVPARRNDSRSPPPGK